MLIINAFKITFIITALKNYYMLTINKINRIFLIIIYLYLLFSDSFIFIFFI